MPTVFMPRQRDRAMKMKRVRASIAVICCITVSGMGGWHGGIPSIAMAQSRPVVVAGLTEHGIVTDLSERTIVIDGRAYEVDRTVEVFDDEGNQIDLSAVTRNAEVRFRVKRDNTHRIDKIMVYLAR